MSKASIEPVSRAKRANNLKRGLCLLVALVSLPLLCGLGWWQLQRAEFKQSLIERTQNQPALTRLPTTLVTLPQVVDLHAAVDSQQLFLLDNQIRHGLSGYHVLALFQDQLSRHWGVVNLGWIAAPATRQQLPDLQPLHQLLAASTQTPVVQRLQGMLVPMQKGLLLADDRWSSGWPKRIQQPDLEQFKALTGQAVMPVMLQLSQPLAGLLDSQWQLLAMPPQKHLGYALQWFALALALGLWLLWFGWIKQDLSLLNRQTRQVTT